MRGKALLHPMDCVLLEGSDAVVFVQGEYVLSDRCHQPLGTSIGLFVELLDDAAERLVADACWAWTYDSGKWAHVNDARLQV